MVIVESVESTDNNAQWHLGCRSDSTVRTFPLSESLSSICSHAHSILNITNAVHTRSPPSSCSRRSGWYFVARRECSLSSACLRLTSRPKTCSRVLSSGSVLDDVADEARQRNRSPRRVPLANILGSAAERFELWFSVEGKCLIFCIILINFCFFVLNDDLLIQNFLIN